MNKKEISNIILKNFHLRNDFKFKGEYYTLSQICALLAINEFNLRGIYPNRKEIVELLNVGYTTLTSGGDILGKLISNVLIFEKKAKNIDSAFCLSHSGRELIDEYLSNFIK